MRLFGHKFIKPTLRPHHVWLSGLKSAGILKRCGTSRTAFVISLSPIILVIFFSFFFFFLCFPIIVINLNYRGQKWEAHCYSSAYEQWFYILQL